MVRGPRSVSFFVPIAICNAIRSEDRKVFHVFTASFVGSPSFDGNNFRSSTAFSFVTPHVRSRDFVHSIISLFFHGLFASVGLTLPVSANCVNFAIVVELISSFGRGIIQRRACR